MGQWTSWYCCFGQGKVLRSPLTPRALSQEHPFFDEIDWHLLAERALPPPWKPPYNAIIPDTSDSPKDKAREAKLMVRMDIEGRSCSGVLLTSTSPQAVMLTAQDHAHYCDIPFSSATSIEQELIENLTIQAARAAASTRSNGRGAALGAGSGAGSGAGGGGSPSALSAGRRSGHSKGCVVM